MQQSSVLKLSIIIPVYNEATHIRELLFSIQKKIKNRSQCEILVVDGGSTDNTKKILSEEKGITLLSSSKGRGKQMNMGAAAAKGEILYFLHADTYPPKNFDAYILKEIANGNQAGCFKMQFRSNHWWLCLASWFTKFNVKFFRGGDQSLYISKKWFNELDGFSEAYPIFEDVYFIRKIYKEKHFTVIQQWITTSARRYEENGVAKLQYHYWSMYLKNWFGATPEDLVAYYKANIK